MPQGVGYPQDFMGPVPPEPEPLSVWDRLMRDFSRVPGYLRNTPGIGSAMQSAKTGGSHADAALAAAADKAELDQLARTQSHLRATPNMGGAMRSMRSGGDQMDAVLANILGRAKSAIGGFIDSASGMSRNASQKASSLGQGIPRDMSGPRSLAGSLAPIANQARDYGLMGLLRGVGEGYNPSPLAAEGRAGAEAGVNALAPLLLGKVGSQQMLDDYIARNSAPAPSAPVPPEQEQRALAEIARQQRVNQQLLKQQQAQQIQEFGAIPEAGVVASPVEQTANSVPTNTQAAPGLEAFIRNTGAQPLKLDDGRYMLEGPVVDTLINPTGNLQLDMLQVAAHMQRQGNPGSHTPPPMKIRMLKGRDRFATFVPSKQELPTHAKNYDPSMAYLEGPKPQADASTIEAYRNAFNALMGRNYSEKISSSFQSNSSNEDSFNRSNKRSASYSESNRAGSGSGGGRGGGGGSSSYERSSSSDLSYGETKRRSSSYGTSRDHSLSESWSPQSFWSSVTEAYNSPTKQLNAQTEYIKGVAELKKAQAADNPKPPPTAQEFYREVDKTFKDNSYGQGDISPHQAAEFRRKERENLRAGGIIGEGTPTPEPPHMPFMDRYLIPRIESGEISDAGAVAREIVGYAQTNDISPHEAFNRMRSTISPYVAEKFGELGNQQLYKHVENLTLRWLDERRQKNEALRRQHQNLQRQLQSVSP